MSDENRPRARYGEAFWRAHHESWCRSELNQREYCEAQGIPLKAFGNWRAKFSKHTPGDADFAIDSRSLDVGAARVAVISSVATRGERAVWPGSAPTASPALRRALRAPRYRHGQDRSRSQSIP